jgi:hypothetical protein
MKREALTFIRILGSGDRCTLKVSFSPKAGVTTDWFGEPTHKLEYVLEHRTWILETFESLATRWNMRLTHPLRLPPDVIEIWEFLPHIKAYCLGVFSEECGTVN